MKILTNFFQFCVKKYSHDLKWQGRAGFFYRNLSSRPNLSHSGYQKSTLIRKIYFLQKPFKKLQLCFCLFKLFSRFQRSIKFKTEMSKIKIFKPFQESYQFMYKKQQFYHLRGYLKVLTRFWVYDRNQNNFIGLLI